MVEEKRVLPSGRASFDYLPALDGFRAISISLVVISHGGLGRIVPGGMGVLIFFVISGFLITRQMIVEIERDGGLNLRAFYLRRFFRLAPAMLLYVGMFSAILVWLGATITATHILSGLLYFANYYYLFVGYPPHNPIGILWSLSVEEHFYIIFPICMIAFRRDPKRIIPVLCVAIVAVLVWRIILHGMCSDDPGLGVCGLPGRHRTFGTDSIFDCILYGCVAALALQYYNPLMHRWLINPVAFAAALAVILGTLAYRNPTFRDTWRFSLQSLSVGIVIINVLFGRWYGKIRDCLSSRPFTWLGKLSYSLYLFHFGVFVVTNDLMHTENLRGIAAYAAYYIGSLALAAASYYFIEKPMVRLRKRVGAHGVPAAAATA